MLPILAIAKAFACVVSIVGANIVTTCPAYAWVHGAPPVGGTCSGYTDPGSLCANAPAGGTFQYGAHGVPDFKTWATSATYEGSGQTWIAGWHGANLQAGVDYPISYYTAKASLIDPAITPPSGCTYYASGSGPGASYGNKPPNLSCTGTNITISGYNLGPVGGHSAVMVFTDSTNTGYIRFWDDFLQEDQTLVGSGAAIGTYFRPGGSALVDIESSEIDGNWTGIASYGQNNPDSDFFLAGGPSGQGLKMRYVYWHNSINRPIDTYWANNVDIQASVFDTWCMRCGSEAGNTGIHGEIWQGAVGHTTGTIASAVFKYNICIVPSTAPANAFTSCVYLATGQDNTNTITLTAGDVESNYIVLNIANASDGSGHYYTTGEGNITVGYNATTTLTNENNRIDNPVQSPKYGSIYCNFDYAGTANGNVGSDVTTYNESGNISLESGGAVTGMGNSSGGATCPPLF